MANRHPIPTAFIEARIACLAVSAPASAAYFGWRTWPVRLVAIFTLLAFPPPAVFTYLAAWWFLPARPGGRLYATAAEERFWRNVSTRPRVTLSELRHRFRALEGRITNMERTVTSEEFQLRRKFRDLEG